MPANFGVATSSNELGWFKLGPGSVHFRLMTSDCQVVSTDFGVGPTNIGWGSTMFGLLSAELDLGSPNFGLALADFGQL